MKAARKEDSDDELPDYEKLKDYSMDSIVEQNTTKKKVKIDPIFEDKCCDESIDKEPLRILDIKKNSTNSTAGFYYGLGCALVHLSMFVALFHIDSPHFGNATQLDTQY